MSWPEIAFWIALGLLGWVYFGYPLVVLAWGRLRPIRLDRDARRKIGPVTVGIPAYNAGQLIEARIEDVLGQRVDFELEVIVASDGSTDELPTIVERLARRDGRIKLLDLPRVGTTAAQTAIFEGARGEVVVLSDAETRFAPGCLAELVAPFADMRVGCATGVLAWRYDGATDTAQQEGLYWRYEQVVRAWESRAGWLAVGTGALLAVRHECYRPVPNHASLDQMLPLHVQAQGRLVLAVPTAVGIDRGASDIGEQFESRVRIATQGIEANLRMVPRLPPWRRPGALLGMLSHKVLRWATPWLGLVSVVAGVLLTLDGGSAIYLLPLLATTALLLLAAAGILASRSDRGVRSGRGAPRRRLPLTGFATAFVVVNAAFALAWLRVLTRRRSGRWQPARSSLPDR
jgi:cellulose synthase/poly-beta-1,6-N-acetylglucosamine synthase-like glycosyltransferase